MSQSFLQEYLTYTENTESPVIYHRWAFMSSVGALLGRRVWINHGPFTVYPNMYTMFLGSPGVRKSTAIKIVGKLIRQAGYKSISSSKSSKEKFILDLAGASNESADITEEALWGNDSPAEMFVMADEFNDFFGNNILEFLSFLGTLWDYEGVYSNRIKSGPSVEITDPTISILGATTPGTFAATFPPEIIGQGFFSRALLIHGEPNGKKFAFPVTPSQEATDSIVEQFRIIRAIELGALTITPAAYKLLNDIYATDITINDSRFATYKTRRFTHLLKLCIILSVAAGQTSITDTSVLHANTTLHTAELFMPKALGEFGRAKSSAGNDKLMAIFENSNKVISTTELWGMVTSEFESMAAMMQSVQNLLAAGKIQWIREEAGFLPVRSIQLDRHGPMEKFVDYSFLTPEERLQLR